MFTTEFFDANFSKWTDIKEKILSLETEAFGKEAFTEDELRADFTDTKNVAVLLRNSESTEIVGFSYAKPFEPETDDSPAKPGETAWIWDVVIKEEFRGRGLSGRMFTMIEDELKHRSFKYLEMNARVANNFAKNIDKHYKDRIVKSFPLDSRWGPQVFFRIRL